MTIMKWTPGWDVANIQDDMGRMFDHFFGFPLRSRNYTAGRWVPRVNVEEQDSGFEITVEVPGMNREDVKVEVNDHTLMIEGERNVEHEKEDRNYHVCERCTGTFQRAFTLPENVDADKIDAEYTNGILTIKIPKTEAARPKEIKVKVK